MSSISFGITCYNSEKTIARAIESALNQDTKPLEVIIIDDCSSDRSQEIIKEYELKYSLINFYPLKKNVGYPSAVNLIFNLAISDFVALFDSDDESHLNRISNQLYLFNKNYKYNRNTIVLGSRNVISKNFTKIKKSIGYLNPANQLEILEKCLLPRQNIYNGNLFGSGSLFCNVKLFKEIGGFDNTLIRLAEIDFWIKATFNNIQLVSTNNPVIDSYKSDNLLPYRTTKIINQSIRKIYKRYSYLFVSERAMNFCMALKLRRNAFKSKNFLQIIFVIKHILFGINYLFIKSSKDIFSLDNIKNKTKSK